MSISPEDAQRLTDLRERMYNNVQKGLPSHAGMTEEDISTGLSLLRSTRSAAAAAGATKAKATKAKGKAASDVMATGPSQSLGDALKGFGDVDLD